MKKERECKFCKNMRSGQIISGNKTIKLTNNADGHDALDTMFWGDIHDDLKNFFKLLERGKINEKQFLEYCWSLRTHINRVYNQNLAKKS